jgi:hypothetical protein
MNSDLGISNSHPLVKPVMAVSMREVSESRNDPPHGTV